MEHARPVIEEIAKDCWQYQGLEFVVLFSTLSHLSCNVGIFCLFVRSESHNENSLKKFMFLMKY